VNVKSSEEKVDYTLLIKKNPRFKQRQG